MNPLPLQGFVYINKAVGDLKCNTVDAEDFMSTVCVFVGLSSK